MTDQCPALFEQVRLVMVGLILTTNMATESTSTNHTTTFPLVKELLLDWLLRSEPFADVKGIVSELFVHFPGVFPSHCTSRDLGFRNWKRLERYTDCRNLRIIYLPTDQAHKENNSTIRPTDKENFLRGIKGFVHRLVFLKWHGGGIFQLTG